MRLLYNKKQENLRNSRIIPIFAGENLLLIQIYNVMKKIFTLIAMAFVAMSVNAQDVDPNNLYPAKEIVMDDIHWYSGPQAKALKNMTIDKTDINDEASTKLYNVLGDGNAYKEILAECFYSEDKGDDVIRPYYTYIDYVNGETGIPAYGLYYKFTPSKAGKLKVQVWVNKGNRKTVIVKGSTGAPMTYGTDYQFEGYVNGQTKPTTTPVIDEQTGEQKIDNDQNPVWVMELIRFSAEEMYQRWVDAGSKQFVLDAGNQPLWGWLTFDVAAGETYYLFQLSSQLGFGGFEFEGEKYEAAPNGELASEFATVVDASTSIANNAGTTGKSVVSFQTASMQVEAVGSATPTSVVPDGYTPGGGGSGISTVKAENANAVRYNMAGQKVNDSFKGIVIENGRKFMSK